MYTILVTDSHELVTTEKERIMCRSKLVNALHFLVKPEYHGMDMRDFTVCLEYILPISRDYCSEILRLSRKLYKGFLEYTLPFDTSLTKEAGEIEIQLTFTNVELNDDGTTTQHVRKTSPTTIEITPIAAWSDIIPDSSLTAIDQRLTKVDTMIEQLEELGEVIVRTAPDGLIVDDKNRLSLALNGDKIGNEVDIAVPYINDGDYDGTYDGVLELEKIGDEDPDDGGNDGHKKKKHHHPKFVELD